MANNCAKSANSVTRPLLILRRCVSLQHLGKLYLGTRMYNDVIIYDRTVYFIYCYIDQMKLNSLGSRKCVLLSTLPVDIVLHLYSYISYKPTCILSLRGSAWQRLYSIYKYIYSHNVCCMDFLCVILTVKKIIYIYEIPSVYWYNNNALELVW